MCVCVCVCVSALTPLRVSCVCVCVLVFTLTEDRLLLISFRRGVSGAPGLFIQRHFTEYGYSSSFELGKNKKDSKLVPFGMDLSESWVRIPISADPVWPDEPQANLRLFTICPLADA